MNALSPLAPRDLVVAPTSGIALNWSRLGWPEPAFDARVTLGSLEVVAVGSNGVSHADPSTQDPRQTALLLLGSAGFSPGCDSLELRYIHEPAPGGAPSARMFITARAGGDNDVADWAVRSALQAAAVALPSTYEVRLAAAPREVGLQWAPYFELRRQESVTWPVWDYIPNDTFYYQIDDDPGDGSGWAVFWDVMARSPEPVDMSFVFRQSELLVEERELLGHVTSQLAMLAETHEDYDVLGYQRINHGCDNARLALESWRQRVGPLLQRPFLARVAARCSPNAVGPVLGGLATALAQRRDGPGAHPMTIESADALGEYIAPAAWEVADIAPWGGHALWGDQRAPTSLRRLPYLYGLNEAASLALMPVAGPTGVPGFPKARRAVTRPASTVATLDGVTLGTHLHHGRSGAQATLPLEAINRHILITGTPGSGKTTSVQTILSQLWERWRVPFLVIECVKTEYRSLLNIGGVASDLRVISVGRDDLLPLRLNPLEPAPGVRREAHASSVLQALRMAMPLQPPLPQLLEVAIDRAYTTAGWDYDTTIEEGLAPPTLRSLLDSFDAVFTSAGYKGEAHNIGVALQVRMRSLLTGARGRVLDTVESIDFDEFLATPLVIELDELGNDEERALVAALLLGRVRASARARAGRGLQHVVVLEEAHRVLPASVPGALDGVERTRADAIEAFCNGIAELRATGEGFVIASQSPSRLAQGSFDMTTSRIVHGLSSDQDRTAMLSDMAGDEEDAELAARLAPGEAIVRWPPLEDAQLVVVRPTAGVDTAARISNEEVRSRMAVHGKRVRSLLPFALCTREVCVSGCDPDRRTEGRRIAAVAPIQPQRELDGPAFLRTVVRSVRAESPTDQATAYCAVVHLKLEGTIGMPAHMTEARSQLRAVLGEP